MRPNFGKHSSVICVIGAKAFGIAVLTAISILNEASTSVQAAQTVVVRRGSFTQSIELTDLKTFVKTGKGSPSLQEVARRLTPEQRSQIQAALKAKYNINQEAARNFVNTGFGNNLSSALASTTPRQDSAGVQAVKTALIQGAKAPEGLSLISAIEGYPSPRLDVDLDQAFR